MSSRYNQPSRSAPSKQDLESIITNPDGAETLVKWADKIGQDLKNEGLATNQIRALYGEVRQIQAEWGIDEQHRQRAARRLILLKPKMRYRARKERGQAVESLVSVLLPAVDLVSSAPFREANAVPGLSNNKDDNFQRFVEFFEAILAYHRAYGGS